MPIMPTNLLAVQYTRLAKGERDAISNTPEGCPPRHQGTMEAHPGWAGDRISGSDTILQGAGAGEEEARRGRRGGGGTK